MKLTTTLTTAILGAALALGLNACSDNDHAGHDHEGHGEHADADHADHADKDHDGGEHADHAEGEHKDGAHAEDDHGHDHAKAIPGPNGGRVVTEVEPHLEFLVTDDRKVRISAVGEDDKSTIPITTQTVSAVAGDRANPTRLTFKADGDALLSEGTLPEGNDFPLVLQIKNSPDAETVREKFNVNFSDCPTCDYKEYACICGHGEGDHDGHDHGHDEKK